MIQMLTRAGFAVMALSHAGACGDRRDHMADDHIKSAVEPEPVTTEGGCGHLRAISSLTPPSKRECEDCVKVGSRWVHLRTCQTCGGTRCCDSSPNRHASKHARASGHPVIASAERGERWLYCYIDDETVEY